MKNSILPFLALGCALIVFSTASAQIYENTYTWHNMDHSAWKIEPQPYQGYVIAGGKFFEPGNTDIYITQFDEFGIPGWTRTHNSGFTQLSTFWKSFTVSPYPTGYFFATSGTKGGQWQYYTLTTNSYGQKFWDQSGPLANGVQFGGVAVATNGGYVATGGNNSGNMIVAKFDTYGVLEWVKSYGAGFGWSIAPVPGGGYVAAGQLKVIRVDVAGNLLSTTNITLPVSPDGSAYTYGEFEEITFLPSPEGFVVTGSAFSNSHSATYTARLNYTGGLTWTRINETVNTSLPGTPVAWANNAVVHNNQIITTWRKGPVSTGGTLYAQRLDFNGVQQPIVSLNNNIPVQEAFATRAHGKLVIGGTRGGYVSAYSYVNAGFFINNFAPSGPVVDDGPALPIVYDEPFLLRKQINRINSQPLFEATPLENNPASRTFYADLRVYPNPTSGLLNIGGALEPGALLRISDLTGRIVLEREIREGETLITADLTGQAKGLLVVDVIGKERVTTKKVVVE